MEAVYKRCSALTEVNTSFCPGCSHGLAFKVIAEIAEELEIQRKLVWATPIGCTTFFFDITPSVRSVLLTDVQRQPLPVLNAEVQNSADSLSRRWRRCSHRSGRNTMPLQGEKILQ